MIKQEAALVNLSLFLNTNLLQIATSFYITLTINFCNLHFDYLLFIKLYQKLF